MKNNIKKIITPIIASAVCAVSIFNTGFTTNASTTEHTYVTQAMISTGAYMSDFIRHESIKYPHNKYWNHGNVEGYTNTPCTHTNGSTITCTRYEVYRIVGKGFMAAPSSAYMYGGNSDVYLQCYGFAFKLASDLFGTNSFICLSNSEVKKLDSNNLYQPRVGDHVRFGGNTHSIFITNVDTTKNIVTYADCNKNNTCQIKWNNKISIDSLRTKVYGVYRPVLVGDFNGDTCINTADSQLLLNRIVNNEPKNRTGLVSALREPAGDMNEDGTLDILDVIRLNSYINGSSSQSYGYINEY